MKRCPLLLTTGCLALLAPAAVAAPAEGEASRELMSFVWQESLWTLIIFLIFFSVLSLVVWPKILGALRAREQKQHDDLQSAENAAKEAQKTLVEYKQQLAEAQKEAQRIIDESRTAAQQVGAQLKAQAEADAKALRERNAAEIKVAKEQAIAELYAHTAEIATQVASKIIRKELSASDQQALVNQSLEELSNLNRN